VRRYALFLPALLIVVADQLTKAWVLATLPEGEPVPVIGQLLMFTRVRNPGTAFGLLRGSGSLLTVITIVAVLFIVAYWFHLLRTQGRISPALMGGLALPLGGALGNLADRIRHGHVVDFIDFRVWPVFNIADMAITTGAVLVAYYFFVLQNNEDRVFRCSGVQVLRSDQEQIAPTSDHPHP
jgi:signal peptidase II